MPCGKGPRSREGMQIQLRSDGMQKIAELPMNVSDVAVNVQ